MEWVLGHMEDADFNDPLPPPPGAAAAAGSGTAAAAPDPESVAMLSSMGFTSEQVRAPASLICTVLSTVFLRWEQCLSYGLRDARPVRLLAHALNTYGDFHADRVCCPP